MLLGTLSLISSLIQSAVLAASSWATRHRFNFSTTKTFLILFSRSHITLPPPLMLYNSPIQYRSSGKFLGLIFDFCLTWKEHIISIKKTALHRLRLLQTVSHTSWGTDRKTLLHLHTTLVLSILDYGCHVYSSASPLLLSSLDSIQHLGLRLALGAFRSSPVES